MTDALKQAAWERWVSARADMLRTTHNENIFKAGYEAALAAPQAGPTGRAFGLSLARRGDLAEWPERMTMVYHFQKRWRLKFRRGPDAGLSVWAASCKTISGYLKSSCARPDTLHNTELSR